MTQLRLLVGRPQKGFHLESIASEQYEELVSECDSQEVLYYFSIDNAGELFIYTPELFPDVVSLTFLPQEDKDYLTQLINQGGTVSIDAVYFGWVTCTKEGLILLYDGVDDKNPIPSTEYITADGEPKINKDYIAFSPEDGMHVMQFNNLQNDVEPTYNEDGNHSLMWHNTVFQLSDIKEDDKRVRAVSAPESLLNFIQKHVFAVK